MSKQERTHEYLCEHVLDEYVTGICDGKRFCFRVDAIKKLTQDGIAISDGEKDGWWVFLLWEELERMFDCEAVDVSAVATYHGSYDGYAITECRFVRSDESLAEIITEQEVREARDYAYENVLEEDVRATLEFLEAKGLLADREKFSADPSKVVIETLPFVTSSEGTGEPAQTEEKPQEEERPRGREGSDIVEDCWRSVSNAFSDMLWDLREHPVRPSLAIEANDATTAMLETLARLAAEYKGMEEGV